MAEITMMGSGINWTGPVWTAPGLRVEIGYEWPDRRVHAMFLGLWEDALPHLGEINDFLAASGLGPVRPNDGESLLGTWGFHTRRWEEECKRRWAALP